MAYNCIASVLESLDKQLLWLLLLEFFGHEVAMHENESEWFILIASVAGVFRERARRPFGYNIIIATQVRV